MGSISNNSVALAGEFAVLSQLVLRGYDANMTLGRTKSVDILVSDPRTSKMFKLEVKTNYKDTRSKPQESKIHGKVLSGWIMNKKHEHINDPDLFYCFVNIGKQTHLFKFYIVPSRIVATYVAEQHQHWLDESKTEGNKVNDSDMRMFRIGLKGETYSVATPTAERYEDRWDFTR